MLQNSCLIKRFFLYIKYEDIFKKQDFFFNIYT